MTDMVKSPSHYLHPSGVECKEVTYDLPKWIGDAIKYVWRYESKGKPLEDLRKAHECLNSLDVLRVRKIYSYHTAESLEAAQQVIKYENEHWENYLLRNLLRTTFDSPQLPVNSRTTDFESIQNRIKDLIDEMVEEGLA